MRLRTSTFTTNWGCVTSREHPVISFSDWEIAQFISMLQRQRPPWVHDALCIGEPQEFFFPGQGQAAYMQRGLDICKRCPVRRECFTFALENKDDQGVWGSRPDDRAVWISEGTDPDDAFEELLCSEQFGLGAS